jgi:hypothetical protein
LLADLIRAALERSRDRLQSQLEAIAAQARDQARPENLAILPIGERDHAAQEMQEVQQQVRRLAELATPAFEVLLKGVADADPSLLAEQAQRIVMLVAPVGPLLGRVNALMQRMLAVTLTPDESLAYDVLLAASTDEMDFSEFEQRLHARLPAADAWVLLRSLSQKSRVRLRIRLVRG